jgi:DNA invertase Pin-like site-specific DNA recombinase
MLRNLVDLKSIVSELTARDVTVEFVKEQLVFTNEGKAMSNLLLSVMGAFAEF